MVKPQSIITPILFISLLLTSGCLQSVEKHYISYIIEPSVVRNKNVAYNKETEEFTVLVIKENNTLSSYRSPIIRFKCTPDIPFMADKDDFSYLFFEATDYDKRIFRDSSGVYQLKWKDNTGEAWMVYGEKRTRILTTITLDLELSLNPFQLIDIDNSELYIKFHNFDNSWEKQYKIRLIGVEI